ncbi:MAG TPA: STAS/SEC14 domain-containing protein [Candidatus Saccharimonadia bacterium]|nr:STAS/SEC14 domain-containing protein [Candidatus Saccharimonadia bacterium]
MPEDSQEPAENQVIRRPQGFVEALIVGEQTPQTFAKLYDEAQPIIKQLKAAHKPLLGLIDMSRQTGYSIASDKAALSFLETLEYDKLALCNAPHAEVAKGILLALDKNDTTKVFNTREEALAWLLAK